MTLEATGSGSLGDVFVFTSNDGGHSPDDIEVLVFYMNKMAQSERTTLWALLEKQGHADMAKIIRRL